MARWAHARLGGNGLGRRRRGGRIGWLVCFSRIPDFFPPFPSISAEIPLFFRVWWVHSHRKAQPFAQRAAQLHTQLQMGIFYSKPFNNLGSDYFLLLQLVCWLRAAKDDGVKLSGVRLKRMGFFSSGCPEKKGKLMGSERLPLSSKSQKNTGEIQIHPPQKPHLSLLPARGPQKDLSAFNREQIVPISLLPLSPLTNIITASLKVLQVNCGEEKNGVCICLQQEGADSCFSVMAPSISSTSRVASPDRAGSAKQR